MTAVEEIIEKYLDDPDQVTESELEMLVVELHKSEQLATELKEQLLLNELLGQRYAVDRQGFLAQVEQRVRDFTRGEQQLAEQVSDLRDIAENELVAWNDRNRRSRQTRGWMAAALLLFVGLIGGSVWFALPQFSHVAVIDSLDGNATITRNNRQEKLIPGEPFQVKVGDKIRTANDTGLVFTFTDDGSQVLVGGNSTIRFLPRTENGGKRVSIDSGQISAKVTPQRAGNMQFETPMATAEIVGTEFVLSVEPMETRLYVTEGTVRLERNLDGRFWLVHEGYYGIVTKRNLGGDQFAWPSNRSELLYVFETAQQVNFVKDRQTGLHRETIAEPRNLGDLNRDGAMAVTNGAWQAKGIESDLVAACRESNQFSFEAMVRTASLEQSSPAHLVSIATGEGDENFSVDQEGGKLFAKIRTSAAPNSIRVPIATLPDIRPHHVAVTYEAGRLRAYLDGEPTAETQASQVEGDLSNWTPQHVFFGDRYVGGADWKGVLEGIALYGRCMEAEEAKQNSDEYHKIIKLRNSADSPNAP